MSSHRHTTTAIVVAEQCYETGTLWLWQDALDAIRAECRWCHPSGPCWRHVSPVLGCGYHMPSPLKVVCESCNMKPIVALWERLDDGLVLDLCAACARKVQEGWTPDVSTD